MTKPSLRQLYPYNVRYFYLPCGRWYGARVYTTLDEAVNDFIKLMESETTGAVRLYDDPYAPDDDYLWGDEKIDRTMRRQLASVLAREVTA